MITLDSVPRLTINNKRIMGMLGVYMLADEATIERLSNDEDLFEAVEEYGDESTTIAYDIDKLWDGLHFLLTGVSAQETIENNPLSEAIVGTKIFDCEDFIAYTYPNHIKDIVDALNKADIEVLIESMDLSKFRKAKIYPNIWVKKDEKQLKAELKKEFLNLKAFYENALNSQTGVLVSIY